MNTNETSFTAEDRFRSFGLSENPFQISPDPRFLFAGPAYAKAITDLQAGIESRCGLMVLTGEAGTGKTTLMRYFLQWLAERRHSTSYVFHAHLDPAGLFEFVLRDFGVPVISNRKTDLVTALHRWLLTRDCAGDTPVMILDEAQGLPVRTLSELCLLLNLEGAKGKLLQVVLAGQPELDEKLHRPDLHALRQRICVRCRLPVLTLEETATYIESRLKCSGASGEGIFPAETVQWVYSYARGIPRVVNLVCEHALDNAYAEGKVVVAPSHVRRAAAEFDLADEVHTSVDLELPLNRTNQAVANVEEKSNADIPLVVELFTPLTEPALAPQPTLKNGCEAEAVNSRETELAASGAAVANTPPAPVRLPANGKVPSASTTAAVPRIELKAVRPGPVGGRAGIAPAAPVPQAPKSSLVEFRIDPDAASENPKLVTGAWKKNAFDAEWKLYWHDVRTTFQRDFNQLTASIGPALAGLLKKMASAFQDAHRSVYDSFREWLRRPVGRGGRRDRG